MWKSHNKFNKKINSTQIHDMHRKTKSVRNNYTINLDSKASAFKQMDYCVDEIFATNMTEKQINSPIDSRYTSEN